MGVPGPQGRAGLALAADAARFRVGRPRPLLAKLLSCTTQTAVLHVSVPLDTALPKRCLPSRWTAAAQPPRTALRCRPSHGPRRLTGALTPRLPGTRPQVACHCHHPAVLGVAARVAQAPRRRRAAGSKDEPVLPAAISTSAGLPFCCTPPSTFSRCYNRDLKGGVIKMTELSPTARRRSRAVWPPPSSCCWPCRAGGRRRSARLGFALMAPIASDSH